MDINFKKIINSALLLVIIFLTQSAWAMEGKKCKERSFEEEKNLYPPTKKREVASGTLEELPVKTTFEAIPDEVLIRHIFPLLNHQEIVFSFGCLSSRYHNLSKDRSVWREAVIPPSVDAKETSKFFRYFLHVTQENPTLPIHRLQITGQNMSSGDWNTLASGCLLISIFNPYHL